MDNKISETLEIFGNPEFKGINHEPVARKSNWLYSLCHDVLQMNDEDQTSGVGLQPETHNELCTLLEDSVGDCFFRGKTQKKMLILLPRGSYKTSVTVGGLPLGITTKNPNARGLIVTHVQPASKKRLSEIKWHFTKNIDFAEVYGDDWKPEYRDAVWSDYQITVAKRTLALREPTIDTASVGKDMTGSHYDYIIADDLVQRENVKTPEKRQEVYDYLFSLLSLLDPGGTLIVIGTRWHPDDAYGRILKEEKRREMRGQEPNFKTYIRSCWDGLNGLFFPKKLTREFLEEIRTRPGGGAFFAANYENNPIADEDRTFNMDIMQIVDFNFLEARNGGLITTSTGRYPVDVTMSWDPAGRKPNSKTDFHGLTVVGTDAFDRWWVCEATAFKAKPSDVIDRVCNLVAYYQPRVFIIESVGGYGLWIDLLETECLRRGLRVRIQEDTTGSQNKSTRIQMLEPRWNNRGIILKANQKTLIDQISDFSAAAEMVHEDILDSLAKHVGFTIPCVESNRIHWNPVDPEWVVYKKEQQGREFNTSPAGIRGTRWVR